MLDGLPHLVVPTIVFDGLVCALSTAAGWHLLGVIQALTHREGRRSN